MSLSKKINEKRVVFLLRLLQQNEIYDTACVIEENKSYCEEEGGNKKKEGKQRSFDDNNNECNLRKQRSKQAHKESPLKQKKNSAKHGSEDQTQFFQINTEKISIKTRTKK